MFEILDTLLGPLFRQNPIKYALDRRYRIALRNARGKEARYVFVYQVLFVVASVSLAIIFVRGL